MCASCEKIKPLKLMHRVAVAYSVPHSNTDKHLIYEVHTQMMCESCMEEDSADDR
jgi:hypothetical protein